MFRARNSDETRYPHLYPPLWITFVEGLWTAHFSLWAEKPRPQHRVIGPFEVVSTTDSMPIKKENPQAYSAAGLWVLLPLTEGYFFSSSPSSSSSSSSSSSMASKRSSTILDRASILSSSAGRNSSYSPLTTIFMM